MAGDQATPGRIFISYRRDEAAYPAGWLFDRLAEHFGPDQVFKDVDSIEPGDDFTAVINNAVGSCDVLLALIGPQWLSMTDEDGERRIDKPSDFVRLEIEAALTRHVRVIPILVDGATIPKREDLPPSLADLVRHQALELSPSRFRFDTSRLLKVLDKTLAELRTPERTVVASTAHRSVADSGAGVRRRSTARWWLGLAAAVGLVAAVLLRPQPQPSVTVPETTNESVAPSGPQITPLPDRFRTAGRIKVGYVAQLLSSGDNLAPFLALDTVTGDLRGFDYDLAQEMGRRLGVKFTFGRLPYFTHSFQALFDGRIDISMSVLRDLGPERGVSFVDYLRNGTVLLVPSQSGGTIGSPDDLCGTTVLRPLETPAGSLLTYSDRCHSAGKARITLMTCPTLPQTQLPEAQHVAIRMCPSGADPLQLLIQGRAVAALTDRPLAEEAMQRNPSIRQRLQVAPIRMDGGPYGIAVRDDDGELKASLESALRAIVADGTYGRILSRWDLTAFALES